MTTGRKGIILAGGSGTHLHPDVGVNIRKGSPTYGC